MAKSTRSSTTAKAGKGKTLAKAKAPAKKTVASKPVAKKATKPAPKQPAPKKPAAKKPVGKKVPTGKPAAKKAAKPVAARKVAKPAAKKPASKPVAARKSAKPASKPVAKKVAKPAAKPMAKKAVAKPVAAAKPAVVAKPAHAKPVHVKPVVAATAKTAPHTHKPSPPAAAPFKGKVASATAMVLPRTADAHGHASHKSSKHASSPMNKQATKNQDNGVTREDGRYALPATTQIALPKGYRPSSREEYMSPMHLAYFRNKLRDWREQLVEESRQTMDNLREEVRDVGDEAERATRETENSLELRTRDRYRKLISKIDKALRRIEDGSYGYCEETEEEFGVERLDARPIATLSLDAQARREHLQKQMGD